MEFSLLAAAAIAVTAFWGMLRWEAPRGNAGFCTLDLWDAGLVSMIGGVFIGRVVSMITAGIGPLTDPGQVLFVRSGVSTPGAAVGAIAVFLVLARRDLVSALDAIAPATLAALAGWHGGCMATGGCLGTPSSLPWAFRLEGSAVTRHPVELYAACGYAIVAVALAVWKQRGHPPSLAPAACALIAAGGIRLVTEPIRISLSGGPVILYGIGCVVGLVMLIVVGWRHRDTARTAAPR